jgi:hypothetical protein
MTFDITPKIPKGAGRIGLDHNGKSKGVAAPGDPPAYHVSHESHGTAAHQFGSDAHGGKPNIARDGAPKHVTQVPFHIGMTEQQRAFAGMGGTPNRHGGIPGIDPLNPNAETAGKKLTPPAVHPNMKRPGAPNDEMLRQLGNAVLATAVRNK